jgi:O-antigen/teichoic acid export membrane protein
VKIENIAYLFSQALVAAFNWGVLILLAKYTSTKFVGEYSLMMAYIVPISILTSLQMRGHYLTSSDFKISDYFSLRLILIIFLFIITGIIFSNYFDIWVVIGLIMIKAGEVLFDIPFVYEQKNNFLLKASKNYILRSSIVYGVFFLGIILSKKIEGSILISGIISFLIPLLYTRKLRIKFKLSNLEKLFKSIFFLGMSGFILSFNISLPRMFLAKLMSYEDVAVFTVLISLYSIWQLFFNNYFNSILHKLRDKKVIHIIQFPLILFSIVSIIFLFVDSKFYSLFFSEDFLICSQYSFELLIMIFLSLLSSSFYYHLLSKNIYSSHFFINISTFILNLIILYPLIQFFEIRGALYSWIIVNIAQLCMYLYTMRKHV